MNEIYVHLWEQRGNARNILLEAHLPAVVIAQSAHWLAGKQLRNRSNINAHKLNLFGVQIRVCVPIDDDDDDQFNVFARIEFT